MRTNELGQALDAWLFHKCEPGSFALNGKFCRNGLLTKPVCLPLFGGFGECKNTPAPSVKTGELSHLDTENTRQLLIPNDQRDAMPVPLVASSKATFAGPVSPRDVTIGGDKVL